MFVRREFKVALINQPKFAIVKVKFGGLLLFRLIFETVLKRVDLSPFNFGENYVSTVWSSKIKRA